MLPFIMRSFSFWVIFASLSISAAILGALEIGWRIGRIRHKRDADGAAAGTGAVDGAIFALMGLLLAFMFSGAASRFDARRSLIVEEANTIGAAYLRLDLLPAESQVQLKEDFRYTSILAWQSTELFQILAWRNTNSAD